VKSFKEKRMFVEELKKEWRTMWRERIDDRVRAEGASGQDYPHLFIERGTVIVATRDFRPPDFHEILEHHEEIRQVDIGIATSANPVSGGWGKFSRTHLISKKRREVDRNSTDESRRRLTQQMKKGGRGWLHAIRLHDHIHSPK
jgi:hypothetical protein